MTSLKEDGVDDTLCALVNIITAIIALFIYLLILAILRIRKDRFSAPVYAQMFHMGIADCIQLLFHLFGGVVTLAQFDMPTRMNQIFGAILNSAWWGWIMFVFAISMNQFVTFYYQKYYNTVYTKRCLRLQIATCWTVMAASLIYFLTPVCSFSYYRYTFSWRYDDESPLGPTTEYVEFVYVTFILAVSAVFYGCIFVKIYSMGKHNLSRSSGGMRHETRVLIQASMICGYTIWTQIHWQFYYLYMPDSRYTDFSCNYVWILNAGMSPILYLTLNKSVRKAFVELMKLQKPQASTAGITVIPSTYDHRRG